MTVRRTATLLGVDRTTAFRWRHRLLRALHDSDDAPLGSTVAIHETSFPHSEKGNRILDRPPRRRSVFGRLDIPFAWVVVAGDDRGRIASDVAGPRRPGVDDLTAVLGARLERTSEILSTIGPYGAAGLLAARSDRAYRRVQRRSPEFAPVDQSILSLRRWMRRFHGVATRYLPNYLAWHRILEASAGAASGRPAPALRIARRPGALPSTSARHWLLAGHFP